MRIIAKKALRHYWESRPDCQDALSAWYAEAKAASWGTSMDVKQQYASASIINNQRVVFNIKGNHHRLVIKIDYTRQVIFILWIGSHKEYDKINVETISYEAR